MTAEVVARALGAAGWRTSGDPTAPFTFESSGVEWSAWLEAGRFRLDAADHASEARLEMTFTAADVTILLTALVPGITTHRLQHARTYVRALLDQGVCASVDVLEGGRWVPLAVSIGRQAEEGRGLVDAVLGAAGWQADRISMEGLPRYVTGSDEPVFEAPACRHVNALATLSVAPLDGRRVMLWVGGRLPLLVHTANIEAGDHDPAEDVLRLILEWQERLGEGEADAGFWRALMAIGVRGITLKDGKLDGTLAWSRLDADGRPQGGYLLRCACQALGGPNGRPSDHAEVVKVVRDVVHQGWSEIYCECRRCERRWKVDEDTGYHFPTWHWSDVTNESEHSVHYE